MFIAQQKLRENIAEYILYMYQIEDVLRGFNFNVERILNEFVIPQLPDKAFVADYRRWYDGLANDMQSERIEEQGHLMAVQEVLVELSYLHNSLLTVMNDEKYKSLYEAAVPYIDEFRDHSNLKDKNAIEVVFHALYMKLLLRLKKSEISPETEEAFDAMRIMVAYLSRSFHQMKNGEGEFWKN